MSDDENDVHFGELTPAGYVEHGTIKQSDMQRCPFAILDYSHYRGDGTCKCDDARERVRMIEDWEYKPSDFEGIPLRSED